MQLLRDYCLGEREVKIEVVSDPATNFHCKCAALLAASAIPTSRWRVPSGMERPSKHLTALTLPRPRAPLQKPGRKLRRSELQCAATRFLDPWQPRRPRRRRRPRRARLAIDGQPCAVARHRLRRRHSRTHRLRPCLLHACHVGAWCSRFAGDRLQTRAPRPVGDQPPPNTTCAAAGQFAGRVTDVEKIELVPVLIKKGATKLALYGLGHVRDERLTRSFEHKGNGCAARPAPRDWFSLMAVRQNRHPRGGGR